MAIRNERFKLGSVNSRLAFSRNTTISPIKETTGLWLQTPIYCFWRSLNQLSLGLFGKENFFVFRDPAKLDLIFPVNCTFTWDSEPTGTKRLLRFTKSPSITSRVPRLKGLRSQILPCIAGCSFIVGTFKTDLRLIQVLLSRQMADMLF